MFKRSLLISALLLSPFISMAQSTKAPIDGAIKLIVPFAPGGGVDIAARLIAKQVQANTALNVIVENRAGASGTVGGNAVRTANADGQTLLFSASTHVLAKQVLAAPPYDPVTDFAPIARVGEAPLLLVIDPKLAPRKLSEVMSYAKGNADKFTAALPALGAASHIGTLLFASQGSLQLTTAPYRGTAPALTDVAGGHAQMLMDSIISLAPMAKEGKVRPIAVTSARRSAQLPDVPTAVESGYANLVYSTWYGVWAQKGLSDERVQWLNAAFNRAVGDLAKSGDLAKIGVEPVAESTDQFKRFIAADVAKASELLRAAGFKPE